MFETALPMILLLLSLTVILEAVVKTIDRIREIVRNIIDKKFCDGDLQKLELMSICIITTILLRLSLIDAFAQPVLGPEFNAGLYGYILTGLVISRGSQAYHWMLENLQNRCKGVKANNV